MQLLTLAILALAGFSAATPGKRPPPKVTTVTVTTTKTTTTTTTATVTAPACPDISHTADFEDLKFTESPDPPTAPPKPYKGLIYENFYVDEYDGFIPPASGKNTLISYDNRIARVIKPAHGTFDLYTIAVACSSGYPQAACEIIIEGTTKTGAKKRATFVYPALDSSVGFSMVGMHFKQWYDLVEIRVLDARLVDRPVEDEFRPGFVIDDVRYNLKDYCGTCEVKKVL